MPRALLGASAWALLMLIAGAGWFQTGRGLAFRFGLGEVAPGIGALVAVIVVLTLVRWARGDVESRALATLQCPSCREPLETRHEHAAGSMPGRQLWTCVACGFGSMAPLTCEGCAA